MLPRIRIDVDVSIGEAEPYTVSCFFDALDPIPLRAHEAHAISEAAAADVPEKERSARLFRGWADLFDMACVEARVKDTPVPLDKLSFSVKAHAAMRLMEIWTLKVKAPGQPSLET